MRRLPIIACICSFLFLRVFAIQAQDLAFGVPIEGTLAANETKAWDFIAQEGQMLSFVVRATDGIFDPVLHIEDLNNNILIQNDDYDFPNSTDAVIEGFSAPRAGSYRLVINGFAGSAGSYELLMLPGYSHLALHDVFANADAWAEVDVGNDNRAVIAARGGELTLSQEGIQQRAFTVATIPEEPIYYASVNITDINGSQGWQTGMVLRYQDEANHYLIEVNDRGSWRMRLIHEGEQTILRDWGTHPAIVAGQSNFMLSVLVHDNTFDVFYNGQYIGSEIEDTISQPGAIGLLAETVNAIGSSVTASFDDLMVTSPLYVDDSPLFPQQLVATNSTYTVRELERRNVIPGGGDMVLTVPESFAQNVTAGISRFPIASDSTFTNFVLGASVSWRTMGSGLNGCGLVVRDGGERDAYILAYVDSEGGYGLARRENNQFLDNMFNNVIDIGQGSYELLLIAIDDTLHYYIEGQYVGKIEHAAQAGGIAEAVVNFEPVDTACRFDNVWLWRLDN